jgi:hypothetical protein
VSDYHEAIAVNHPLTMVRFNRNATFIATASEKRMLIRIIKAVTEDIVRKLRRGSFHANINVLTLEQQEKSFMASSEKVTVHLFGLEPNTDQKKSNDNLETVRISNRQFWNL